MTPRERWHAAINHEATDRVPTDFWATPEVEEGLMKHLGVSSTAEVDARLHIDRPLVVSDEYAGPPLDPGTDPFGIVLSRTEYQGGAYDEAVVHPLAGFESVDEIEAGYEWPDPDWWDVSHVPAALELAGDRPVKVFMAGVYTDYTRLRGMEQAFVDFAVNHDIVAYCMDRMYGICEERAARLIEVADGRIDVAWVGNDLGSQQALMCSPETVRTLFVPGLARMAALAHQAGITFCLHSDGAIREAIPDLIDAGTDVLNPIQWRCAGMEREGLVADFGDRLTFHGGVDNQETLASNDAAAVRAEVRENIDILGSQDGYILAPCHNVQPVTRAETIVAMYDEAYRYGLR